ncbi:MAG: alpha/beta hydrolase [Lentilitoribacter sp.]
MDILLFGVLGLSVLLIVLFIYTQIKSAQISKNYPPIGEFYDIDGVKIHAKYIKAIKPNNNPPIVFIHGASGNLRDQISPFPNISDIDADILFIDRPGHGWSERGPDENKYPDQQAAVIAKLMDQLAIEKAIMIGHSFGGAVLASFAIHHPSKIHSLIFLAPVAYPWPGGVRWYYTLTSLPVLGWLFANTLALIAGLQRIESGSECVFWPNKMPNTYVHDTAPELVLRPKTFQANAKDIVSLFNYLCKTWPKYKTINTPTIIISGNRDTVVFPYIHSDGLHQHIKGSELYDLENLGHKPDHIATELTIAAIKKLRGDKNIDLKKIAEELDQKLSRHLVSQKTDISI